LYLNAILNHAWALIFEIEPIQDLYLNFRSFIFKPVAVKLNRYKICI